MAHYQWRVFGVTAKVSTDSITTRSRTRVVWMNMIEQLRSNRTGHRGHLVPRAGASQNRSSQTFHQQISYKPLDCFVMLVVHPVERQSGGVLQSSRVNTIAEDSRSSKANSWCRNRLRRICSSQVPLQYRVVELGTWARQRQKRLKTLTISQSRILQNRVVQDNEMRDARRLLPTNAAYVSSHSPGDQYHSECAEQSKLTSCAHQQAHQQSLCTSTVTVHISSYCAHQQLLCTSTVTGHISSYYAHQQSLCTSAVTVHISSYWAHQQSLCTSAVTVHINSYCAHQQLLCTSTVTVHISSHISSYCADRQVGHPRKAAAARAVSGHRPRAGQWHWAARSIHIQSVPTVVLVPIRWMLAQPADNR